MQQLLNNRARYQSAIASRQNWEMLIIQHKWTDSLMIWWLWGSWIGRVAVAVLRRAQCTLHIILGQQRDYIVHCLKCTALSLFEFSTILLILGFCSCHVLNGCDEWSWFSSSDWDISLCLWARWNHSGILWWVSHFCMSASAFVSVIDFTMSTSQVLSSVVSFCWSKPFTMELWKSAA